MSGLIFIFMVLVIVLVLFLYSVCVISSRCSREEERENFKKIIKKR